MQTQAAWLFAEALLKTAMTKVNSTLTIALKEALCSFNEGSLEATVHLIHAACGGVKFSFEIQSQKSLKIALKFKVLFFTYKEIESICLQLFRDCSFFMGDCI